jgi:alkylated DNA repair dioxygenase AlkB
MSQANLERFFKKRKHDGESEDAKPQKKVKTIETLDIASCNMKNITTYDYKGLDIVYMKRFLPADVATQVFTYCLNELTWYKPTYFDTKTQKMSPSSRFMTYFGGISRENKPYNKFPEVIARVRDVVQEATKCEYNFVLLNLYMYETDHINYHSDRELGTNPTIASISLGGTRDFVMRRIADHNDKKKFALAHGDLLVMKGTTQSTWHHAVPKRSGASKLYHPRINFTFRYIPLNTPERESGYGLRDGEPYRYRGDKLVSIAKEMKWMPHK